MMVKCLTDKGHDLPDDYRGLYFTGDTIFHVRVDEEYEVYEMAVFNSSLIALVVDSTGRPNWYPIEFFKVSEPRMPSGWLFARRAGDAAGMTAVWGHPRLVGDQGLDEALASHEEDALRIFWSEIASAWSE